MRGVSLATDRSLPVVDRVFCDAAAPLAVIPAAHFRRLACAVLRSAVADATRRARVPPPLTDMMTGFDRVIRSQIAHGWDRRLNALRFLGTANPMLDWWCGLAGLEPDAVLARYGRAYLNALSLDRRGGRPLPPMLRRATVAPAVQPEQSPAA